MITDVAGAVIQPPHPACHPVIIYLNCCHSDEKWSSQVKTLAITILPPWWQTFWFIGLAVLAITSLITYIFIRRVKKIRYEADLKQQLAELEIKGLHAQMNPHFIFNSLNSIKEMILEDQKQNASRYLSKFAQLIRTSLEQSRQTFISIRQCAEHLQQYLEMVPGLKILLTILKLIKTAC